VNPKNTISPNSHFFFLQTIFKLAKNVKKRKQLSVMGIIAKKK
jgi:hypothetical protein